MDTLFNLTSCVFLLFLFALILDLLSSRLLNEKAIMVQRVILLFLWVGAVAAYLSIVYKAFCPVHFSTVDFRYYSMHVISLSFIQFILQSTMWIYMTILLPGFITKSESNELRIWCGLFSIIVSLLVFVLCLEAIDARFVTVGMIMSLIGLLFWALSDALFFANRLSLNYLNQIQMLYKVICSLMRQRFTIGTPAALLTILMSRGWILLLPVVTVSIASGFLLLSCSWLQFASVPIHSLHYLDLFVAIVFPTFAASIFTMSGRLNKGKLNIFRVLSWFAGLVILVLSICRFIESY